MFRILALSLMLLLQAPQGDDGGTDSEEGKPAQCDNYKNTAPDHKCACDRAMQDCQGKMPQPPADVRMDKKCKTYCRQQHCMCAGHGCTS